MATTALLAAAMATLQLGQDAPSLMQEPPAVAEEKL